MKPRNSSIERALPFLAAAVAGVWSIQGIWDADFWWHLASGRWMWEHRAVLRADPFTWTVAGHDWLDHEWLFQVFLYGAYKLGEIRGVLLLKAALLGIAALGVSRSLGRGLPAGLNAALVLSLCWCARFRDMARAELISLCLFPFFVWGVLEISEDGPPVRTRWFWLLPGLMAIWANSHPGFWHGFAVIFIAVLASLPKSGRYRAFLALGLACALAALINPYGVGIYGMTLKWTRTMLSGVAPNISEFASVPLDRYFPFWACLLGAWGACAWKSWRAKTIDLLAWGLLLYATWAGQRFVRNIPFALMILAPVAARSMGKNNFTKSAGRWLQPAACLLCAALLILGCRRARWEVDRSKYPVGAADFILNARPLGPGYNDFNLGSYLTWAFYGKDLRIFLDGRLNVEGYYGVWEEAQRARTVSPESLGAWKALMGRWSVEWCLMEIPSYRLFYEGRPVSVFAYYFPAAQWALVYHDFRTALYVRRGAANQGLISRYERARTYPDIASGEPARAEWKNLFEPATP